MGVKVCSKCNKEKLLEDFNKRKKSKDGYNYCCKSCVNSNYIKKKADPPKGMKECSSCKEIKPTELFSKNSKSKSGFKSYCKVCASIKNKDYRERCPEVDKLYRENNKDILAEKNSQYYQNNKESIKTRIKEWQISNPEKVKISKKKHADKNKKHYQEKNREWENNKLQTDPQYRVTRNLRSLIGQSFSRILKKKLKRSKKSEELLGCTFEFFLSYIEAQFTESMSFDNYGEWELDHIKPVASASSLEEVEDLNHYTNFRPIWRGHNRQKWSKIEEVQLRLL